MSKSEIEQLRGLVIERVDMSREPDDSELHEIIDSVIEKVQRIICREEFWFQAYDEGVPGYDFP